MAVVVNLGCGGKTHPACINIDRSVPARLKRSLIGRATGPLVVGSRRLEQLRALDGNIVFHDLRRGIPSTTRQ